MGSFVLEMRRMEGSGLVAVMVLAVLTKAPSCRGVCGPDTGVPQQCQDPYKWTTNGQLQSNETISDMRVLFENPGWSVSQSFTPNLNSTEAASLDVSSQLDLTFTDNSWQSIKRHFQCDGYTWNSLETNVKGGISVNKSFRVNDLSWSVWFLNSTTATSASVETPLSKVTLTASLDDIAKCTINIAVIGKTDQGFSYNLNVTLNSIVDFPLKLLDENTRTESQFRSNDSDSIIYQKFTINDIKINVLYFINNTGVKVMVCVSDRMLCVANNLTVDCNNSYDNDISSSLRSEPTFSAMLNCNFSTLGNNSRNLKNFDWSASFIKNGTTWSVSLKTYEYLNGSDMSPAVYSFDKNLGEKSCENNDGRNVLDCYYVENPNLTEIQTKHFQWTSSLNTNFNEDIVILFNDSEVLAYKSILNLSVPSELSSTIINITTPAYSLLLRSQQQTSLNWPWGISCHVKKNVTGFYASFAACSGYFNPPYLHLRIDTQQISSGKGQNVDYCSNMIANCSLVQSNSHLNCSATIIPSTPTTPKAFSSSQVSQTTMSTSVTGTITSYIPTTSRISSSKASVTSTSTITPFTIATSRASSSSQVSQTTTKSTSETSNSNITPVTTTTFRASSSSQVSQSTSETSTSNSTPFTTTTFKRTTNRTSVTGTSSSGWTQTPTVAPSSASSNTTMSRPSARLSTTMSTIENSTIRQSIEALKSDSQVMPIAVGVAVPAVIILLLVMVLMFLVRRRRRRCPGSSLRARARGPYDDLNGYQSSSDQTRIYTELNGNSGVHVNDMHTTGLTGPARTSDYYSVIKDGTATGENGAFEPMNSIYTLAKDPFSEAKTDPAPRRQVTDETNFSSPYECHVNADVPPELPPKKKSACLSLHDKFDDGLDIETPSNDCPQHQSQDVAESLYDTVRASAALPSHSGLYDTVNRTATRGHFRPDSQEAAGLGRTGDYHFLDPEPEEPETDFPPLPPKAKHEGSGLYHYLDPETPLQQTPDDKENYQTVEVDSDTDPSHGHLSAVGEVGGEYSSLNINDKRKNVHDATAMQETEVYSHLHDDEGEDYSRLDREGHGQHVLDEDYSRLQQ